MLSTLSISCYHAHIFSFSRNNADKEGIFTPSRTSKRPFAHHARMSTSLNHAFFSFSRNHATKRAIHAILQTYGERAPPLLRIMLLKRGLKSSVSSHNVPSVTGGWIRKKKNDHRDYKIDYFVPTENFRTSEVRDPLIWDAPFLLGRWE